MKSPIININKETDKIMQLENKVFDIHFKKMMVDCIEVEEFNGCIFDDCVLINSNEVDLIDCIFNHCNLSNLDFSSSLFLRTQINNSKMLGVEAIKSKFDNVLIQESVMDYCNFNNSKFVDSEINDCQIKQLYINESEFKKMKIAHSEVEYLELFKSKLKSLDISSSEIKEMLVNNEDIKGIVCNNQQAIMLALKLGIIIK